MNERVVIVGAGFAGLNCAQRLGGLSDIDVVVIDRQNHHLFQPLLYQVATAGLSPANIAMPIRGLLSRYKNIRVVQAEVTHIELASGPDEKAAGAVTAGDHVYPFDYLLLAAGAQHAYFGHEEWEPHAPGLKTLAQATEIRQRILAAFEAAELADDPEQRRAQLTFVIVGGGPTGVELAGAIGEMSRYTLSKDFRRIDPAATRIILLEAGPRILQSFPEDLARRATQSLERLGVQVWSESPVGSVDAEGVTVGGERIRARTVLWAAGVRASETGSSLGVARDRAGRVEVNADLTLPGHPRVFVAGDQSSTPGPDGKPLPGVATVALQQGRYVAQTILDEHKGRPRRDFVYRDKGQLATIGRRRAVLETGSLRLSGFGAWVVWLLVHIYYLTGFRNRLLVLLQWAWSYFTFARGARLIVDRQWRSYAHPEAPSEEQLARQRELPPSVAGHPQVTGAPQKVPDSEDGPDSKDRKPPLEQVSRAQNPEPKQKPPDEPSASTESPP